MSARCSRGVRVVGVFGHGRHAQAGFDDNRNLVENEWHFQEVLQLLDDMSHVVDGRQPRQQNAELVGAEPRDHVGREQRAAQAHADLLQQVVAAVVTERVVDLPEVFEVHVQHRQRMALLLRLLDGLVHLFAEPYAVWQAGDRVNIGEALDGLVRLAAFLPYARLAQLARDGGQHARGVAFHQVVVGAGLHGRDGDVLADRSGDDDERDVEPLFLGELQRLQAVEVRHGVVGDDQVPGLPGQRGTHSLGRFHRSNSGT